MPLVRTPDRISLYLTPFPPPPPEMVERVTADPWLARELHLFNLADKSTDHANAIRVLFLLWEDLNVTAPSMEGFKYVRHFVSHPRIDDPQTVAFIEAQLGAGTRRYDPFKNEHRALLREWRKKAEAAIRGDLRRQLSG